VTTSDIVKALSGIVPRSLAESFVGEFVTIRRDFLTGTLGRAAPGKFVEDLVRVLQQLETGTAEAKPDIDEYLRKVENKVALDEGLRVCAARIGRGMYTLRNKRTIAHTGSVDPNRYDLAYLYHAAQWVMAELIRQCAGITMADAGRIIEYIEAPITLLVEDFGGFQTVLPNATVEEEILALLRHRYPNSMDAAELKSSMRRRSPNSVTNSLRKLWQMKLVEEVSGAYKLTSNGVRRAEDVLRTWAENATAATV